MRRLRWRLILVGLAVALVADGCSTAGPALTPEQAYEQAILGDRPIAYYPLNESSGAVVHDRSGHSHDATLKGGVTLSVKGGLAWTNDTAMQFDGTSGEIDTTLTQANVMAYSVEVWLNTAESATGSGRAILEARGPSFSGGKSLTLGFGGDGVGANSRAFFVVDADFLQIGVYAVTPINDGKWHQVVGTWAGRSGGAVAPAQFALYLDGKPAATVPVNSVHPMTPPLTGSGPIKIGRHDAWNTYYKGSLERVAIYGTALTSDRVQAHYRLAISA